MLEKELLFNFIRKNFLGITNGSSQKIFGFTVLHCIEIKTKKNDSSPLTETNAF